jgi:hypothetical protein
MGRHQNNLTLTLRLWCVNRRVSLTGSWVKFGTEGYPVPPTRLRQVGVPLEFRTVYRLHHSRQSRDQGPKSRLQIPPSLSPWNKTIGYRSNHDFLRPIRLTTLLSYRIFLQFRPFFVADKLELNQSVKSRRGSTDKTQSHQHTLKVALLTSRSPQQHATGKNKGQQWN